MIDKNLVGLGNVDNYDTATMEEAINPTITNKFIVPMTLRYALDELLAPASITDNGTITVNNGTFVHDDIDQFKALSARGLFNLLNTFNGGYNSIQQSFLSLCKQHVYTVTQVMGTANAIMLTLNPSVTTDLVTGIIRFKAILNNTGACTINTGNISLPIVTWDGLPVTSGMIVKDTVYGLMPLSDSFILLNPTVVVVNVSANIDDVNTKLNQLISATDPYPFYTTNSEVGDIVKTAFSGSYIGTALLTNSTYNITITTPEVTKGMFAVKFNASNPYSPNLSINNIVKPIKYSNGDLIKGFELVANEIRLLVNTPTSYVLVSRSNIPEVYLPYGSIVGFSSLLGTTPNGWLPLSTTSPTVISTITYPHLTGMYTNYDVLIAVNSFGVTTDSQFIQNWAPSRLFDGSTSTEWHSTNVATNKVITIPLDSYKTISKVEYQQRVNAGQGNYQIQLQASVDGVNYINLGPLTTISTVANAISTMVVPSAYRFPCNFVRLVVISAGYAVLGECRLYEGGLDSVVIPPQPVANGNIPMIYAGDKPNA